MNGTKVVVATMELTEEEQVVLLRMLEQAVTELHGERRRTDAMQYHAEVVREENLVRSLAEKVRKLRMG